MVQHSSLQNLHRASATRATVNVERFAAQSSVLGRTSARASNGTLATAKSLGTLPGGKKGVKDTVGRGNPADFFRIELTEKSRLKLVLFNRSEKQISAAILDATGALVSVNGRRSLVSVKAGEQAEILVRGAEPGVYHIRARGAASGSNRYEMNLFANRSGGLAPLPCGCGV